MQQTNLLTFKDDITKSLNIEQYIQSEFGKLNPQKIKCRKSSATITDISIKFENTQNKLLIEISHKGKTYTSKNKLTKENIEYLCGITNVKEFKINEIIGSKISFSKIDNQSLLIKKRTILIYNGLYSQLYILLLYIPLFLLVQVSFSYTQY